VDSCNDEPLAERLAVMRRWNRWMEERYAERLTEHEKIFIRR
jgi:hypothetical protein